MANVITKKQRIVTVDGSVSKIEDCRLIDGEYYKIGNKKEFKSGQCYKVSNRYYKENSPDIFYDFDKGEYRHISKLDRPQYGITAVHNGRAIHGHFEFDPLENIDLGSNNCKIRNKEIADELGYGIDPNTGKYMINPPKPSSLRGRFAPQKYRNFDIGQYGMADNPAVSFSTKSHQEYIPKIKANTHLEKFGRFINDLSVGIEFETAVGQAPENELLKYGLIPVKDGSISGHEYITIPYFGYKTVTRIQKVTEMLSECTGVDEMCSLHIHLGVQRDDKPFIVALYMLCYRLQQELYEMMPPFKRSQEYFAKKRNKDHCQPLNSLTLGNNTIYESATKKEMNKELIKEYNKIFTFLNEGQEPNSHYNSENKRHIRAGDNKWNMRTRYYWVNLLNLMFSDVKTVEFRMHSGTVNPVKTLNWLFICAAIVKYAMANTTEIITNDDKITIFDVIRGYCDNFGKSEVNKDREYLYFYLKSYIESRQEKFTNHYMKNEIYPMDEFWEDDAEYNFTFEGKNIIHDKKEKEKARN